MTAINRINAIPEALAIHLFAFFTLTELTQEISSVSKTMHRLSNNSILWKTMAVRFDVSIKQGQDPKKAVFIQFRKYAEINRIFISSVEFLRQQIANKPNLATLTTIPENPSGHNVYELYRNILKWCGNTMKKIDEGDHKHFYSSQIYSLFKQTWAPLQIHNSKPAGSFYDPRLMNLFHIAAAQLHGIKDIKTIVVLDSISI